MNTTTPRKRVWPPAWSKHSSCPVPWGCSTGRDSQHCHNSKAKIRAGGSKQPFQNCNNTTTKRHHNNSELLPWGLIIHKRKTLSKTVWGMQKCKIQNSVLKMQDKHRHSGWVWWPLWIAVLFSGSNSALQPTSHKKHWPSHFLLTFIPPLIPLSPAALFYLCLPHYLSFSAPLFHPPYFFFCHSTQLNSFLSSRLHDT